VRFTVKVVLGYTLVSALAVVTAVVFLFAFKRYERANHVIFLLQQIRDSEQSLQSSLLRELQAIQAHLAHPAGLTAARVRETAAKSAAQMKLTLAMDRELVRSLGELTFPGERLRYFEALQAELTRYEGRLDEIDRLLAADPAFDRLQARRLTDELAREILSRVDDMDRTWTQNVGEVVGLTQRERRRATALLGVLLAASLVTALGLTVFVTTSVRRVVRRLSGGMRRVAAGDYDNPVPRGGDPEINELVDRFNAMAEKLKSLEEVRRDFTSMLSHDLKSPLAVIKMYAEALEGDGAGRRREAQAIARSADRMLRLVENVLDYSRVDGAPGTVNPASLELPALVERVCADGGVLAQAYHVGVRAEVEPGLPPVFADEAQLERALHNLVSNGVKYNRAGGTVTVRARRSAGGVRVEVEDTGIGISAADRERLFARYFRSERTRHIRGTGLGLTVTREIVRAHGGDLEITSREGEGTVFAFDLAPAPAAVEALAVA
jgi:signal transduction histidine kinase